MQKPWQVRLRSLKRRLSTLAGFGSVNIKFYAEGDWRSNNFDGIWIDLTIQGSSGAFSHWSTKLFSNQELPLHGFLQADIDVVDRKQTEDYDVAKLRLLYMSVDIEAD